MKPTLIFQAPVSTRSGYGDHARDLLYSLWKLDKFDIKIISTRWGVTPMDALEYNNPFHKWIVDNITPQIQQKPDVYIQVTVPNEFEQKGTYNIGITAGIETTVAPKDWIDGCNRMDLIIGTSEHSKNVFLRTVFQERRQDTNQVINEFKITKPIEVLFEGVDTNIYKFLETPDKTVGDLNTIPEEFCYLFVGHWLKGDVGEDRKNVGMMIKTFAMAFKTEKVKPA
mgnify:CR=1 FL=1